MVFKLKRCQICGQEYQPTNGNQRYCTECGPIVRAEKDRACDAAWRKKNPEKRKAINAKYYKANREYRAIWDKANTEKVKAYAAIWRKANTEKIAISNIKRRGARCANTPVDELLTSAEWLAILAEAHGYCHYCGKEAKLTLDHVIPLSKSGKHSKDNVVAACLHCNDSKGNKTLEVWNTSQRAQLEAAQ